MHIFYGQFAKPHILKSVNFHLWNRCGTSHFVLYCVQNMYWNHKHFTRPAFRLVKHCIFRKIMKWFWQFWSRNYLNHIYLNTRKEYKYPYYCLATLITRCSIYTGLKIKIVRHNREIKHINYHWCSWWRKSKNKLLPQ